MDAEKFASECVYFALFRVVEIAELDTADAATAWAEDALANEDLRQGLVEGVKARMAELELAHSARFAHSD